MLRRTIIAFAVIAGVAAVAPSAAQAGIFSAYVQHGNTYGFYYCNIYVSSNRQYLDYSCTVTDTECDGKGVYVSIRVDLHGDRAIDEGFWQRSTDNAGGCTHKSSRSGRIDSGIGTRGIEDVNFALTRDDRPGYDNNYENTVRRIVVPYPD